MDAAARDKAENTETQEFTRLTKRTNASPSIVEALAERLISLHTAKSLVTS